MVGSCGLGTAGLVVRAFAILTSFSFSQFSNSQEIENSDLESLRSKALKKYSIQINSSKNSQTIPLSVYYDVVLREAALGIKRLDSFSDLDVSALEKIHSPRSKHFVGVDIDKINALCRSVPASIEEGSAVIEIARQYAEDRRESEERIERYYMDQIRKLSLPAQLYFETRIAELQDSEQVGYGFVDIQGMSQEFPSVAYELFKGKCLSNSAIRNSADLKDIYIMSETINASVIEPKLTR